MLRIAARIDRKLDRPEIGVPAFAMFTLSSPTAE